MGGSCCHIAYNLDQVQTFGDFEFIFESDLEFYEQMSKSIETDQLETDEKKKKHKQQFITLVVESLRLLLSKVVKPIKKGTSEEIAKVKDNYLNAIHSVNTLDNEKFTKYINDILVYLN